jgi:hypothetical protein
MNNQQIPTYHRGVSAFGLIFTLIASVVFGLSTTNNTLGSFLLLICTIIVVLFILKPQFLLFLFGYFLLFQPMIVGITRLNIVQNLDEAMIFILFTTMCVKKIIKKETFVKTPIDIPLLSVVLIGLLSTVTNQVVSVPVSLGGLLLFVKGFVIFYIFTNTNFNTQHLRLFLIGFLAVGLFLGVYGILAVFFSKALLLSLGFIIPTSRFGFIPMQSLFGHPGAFSAFMAIIACFSISAVLIRNKKRFIFLTIFSVICVILSLRRTSLAGVVIAFSIAMVANLPGLKINRKRRRNIFIILIGIILIFSAFIVPVYKDLIENYFIYRDTPRNLMTNAGIEVAKDYFPLGSGFGTFGSGITQRAYSPLYYKYSLSHVWGLSAKKNSFVNDIFWPHVLAETGLFGLLCYILIIIGLFRICLKGLAKLQEPILQIFSLGVFMLLIESLVESTKATFYEMSLWTYFYFGSAGIIWALFSASKNKIEKQISKIHNP